MGNIEFLYFAGNPNFTRAYIRGSATPPGIVLTSIFDGLWKFRSADHNNEWELKIRDEVYEASSNVYSLDYVFDLDNCWHYVAGNPSFQQLYISLGYPPDAFDLFILIGAPFGADLNEAAEWPFLTHYWLPRDYP